MFKRENRKYYIAYGSNLCIRQMVWRCPGAHIVGTSEIRGYRLFFKGSKTGAYLTIEPHRDGRVPVAVWSVTDEDIRRLDRYEGYPNFYYRREMRLPVKGRMVDAFVYIMHEERKIAITSDAYFQTCLEGYEDFGFDRKYLDEADMISMKEAKSREGK